MKLIVILIRQLAEKNLRQTEYTNLFKRRSFVGPIIIWTSPPDLKVGLRITD